MKLILILLLLFLNSYGSDEVTRIESIVKDINKLRSDYNKQEEELGIYKYDLRDEKEKNSILNTEINTLSIELKKVKKLLKIKENENLVNKSNLVEISKNKMNFDKCMNSQIIEDDNPFPKLQMKKEFLNDEYKVEIASSFHASSFRLNTSADIYSAINGEKIAKWEKSRSFTSNVRSVNWVKITGYFVDKVWQPSNKEMWVKTTDVTIRVN